MNKTLKIYLAILVVLFAAVIFIDLTKPKPVDWTATYNEEDKIPYGTYILHNELKTLFPNSTVKNIKTTPYQYFNPSFNTADSIYTKTGTYIQIKNFSQVDDISAQELLDFAMHGNTVFISSNYPPQKILDSLAIKVKNHYNFKGKASLSFSNKYLKNDSITIKKGLSNYYFSKLNKENTTVLGYQKFDTINRINYVKIAHGKGHVFIHLQPVVFTNYHLLKNNHSKYAAGVLSYLQTPKTVFYDSPNKVGANLSRSPMRFILSKPALRSAWYLALITLILFMIFNAKRRQRIVKVIKPLENSTVEFTKTIGNLYYETKDHNTIIEKKITYFFEHLRRKYFISTEVLDDKFVKNLSLKTNKPKDKIAPLITLILNLKAKNLCTETDLLALNKAIEDFYTA